MPNFNRYSRNCSLPFRRQNYYYLLMDASWREQNDWIHCDSQGQLLQPLVAIHTCPHRYLRTKSMCSADAVRLHFEREIEPKLERMKSIEPVAKLMTENLNILMRKAFVSLQQHNKTVWTYKGIHQIYEQMRHDVRSRNSSRYSQIRLTVLFYCIPDARIREFAARENRRASASASIRIGTLPSVASVQRADTSRCRCCR